ncbi:hypothetical protein K8I61_07245 [bacterium]|nr:hypothetical protein [bacterium]
MSGSGVYLVWQYIKSERMIFLGVVLFYTIFNSILLTYPPASFDTLNSAKHFHVSRLKLGVLNVFGLTYFYLIGCVIFYVSRIITGVIVFLRGVDLTKLIKWAPRDKLVVEISLYLLAIVLALVSPFLNVVALYLMMVPSEFAVLMMAIGFVRTITALRGRQTDLFFQEISTNVFPIIDVEELSAQYNQIKHNDESTILKEKPSNALSFLERYLSRLLNQKKWFLASLVNIACLLLCIAVEKRPYKAAALRRIIVRWAIYTKDYETARSIALRSRNPQGRLLSMKCEALWRTGKKTQALKTVSERIEVIRSKGEHKSPTSGEFRELGFLLLQQATYYMNISDEELQRHEVIGIDKYELAKNIAFKVISDFDFDCAKARNIIAECQLRSALRNLTSNVADHKKLPEDYQLRFVEPCQLAASACVNMEKEYRYIHPDFMYTFGRAAILSGVNIQLGVRCLLNNVYFHGHGPSRYFAAILFSVGSESLKVSEFFLSPIFSNASQIFSNLLTRALTHRMRINAWALYSSDGNMSERCLSDPSCYERIDIERWRAGGVVFNATNPIDVSMSIHNHVRRALIWYHFWDFSVGRVWIKIANGCEKIMRKYGAARARVPASPNDQFVSVERGIRQIWALACASGTNPGLTSTII